MFTDSLSWLAWGVITVVLGAHIWDVIRIRLGIREVTKVSMWAWSAISYAHSVPFLVIDMTKGRSPLTDFGWLCFYVWIVHLTLLTIEHSLYKARR